jgi:hypothetical protein
MSKMKTVVINGVPYVMRGDMNLPNWRKGVARNDPFEKGHKNYLTTPGACEQKKKLVAEGKSR